MRWAGFGGLGRLLGRHGRVLAGLGGILGGRLGKVLWARQGVFEGS